MLPKSPPVTAPVAALRAHVFIMGWHTSPFPEPTPRASGLPGPALSPSPNLTCQESRWFFLQSQPGTTPRITLVPLPRCLHWLQRPSRVLSPPCPPTYSGTSDALPCWVSSPRHLSLSRHLPCLLATCCPRATQRKACVQWVCGLHGPKPPGMWCGQALPWCAHPPQPGDYGDGEGSVSGSLGTQSRWAGAPAERRACWAGHPGHWMLGRLWERPPVSAGSAWSPLLQGALRASVSRWGSGPIQSEHR